MPLSGYEAFSWHQLANPIAGILFLFCHLALFVTSPCEALLETPSRHQS